MRRVVLLATIIISTWVTMTHAVADTWDLSSDDGSKYTTFIGYVRGQVGGKTCFGMPMIGSPRPSTPRYLLVSLQSNEGESRKTIRLALDKNNLYVVGYSDTFNNKARAFYFKGAPTTAFPGAQVNSLWYTGSYQDLEANAGINREKVGLSKTIVNRLVNRIHGTAITTAPLKKDQAQFLLVVVQMVAEASRFKYIEEQINESYTAAFLKPDKKVLTIVNEWGKITTSVANADPDGTLRPHFTLTGPKGESERKINVEDVRGDIGMLNYVKEPCKQT